MIQSFDVRVVIKPNSEKILHIRLLFMIVSTNSKLLYNCLVKQDITKQHRLIVDIICLRQSYEQHEIITTPWIDKNSNSCNVILKAELSGSLMDQIDTNNINKNTVRSLESPNCTEVKKATENN